jgi:hypothetical protein
MPPISTFSFAIGYDRPQAKSSHFIASLPVPNVAGHETTVVKLGASLSINERSKDLMTRCKISVGVLTILLAAGTAAADAKVKGSRGNDLASIVETHVGSGAQNGHRVAWQQTDLSVNASQFSDFETMSTFEMSQLDAAAWQTVGPYAQRVALELLASLDLDELF